MWQLYHNWNLKLIGNLIKLLIDNFDCMDVGSKNDKVAFEMHTRMHLGVKMIDIIWKIIIKMVL